MNVKQLHDILLANGFKVERADYGVTIYENKEELQVIVEEPGYSAEEEIETVEKNEPAGSKYDPELKDAVFELMKNK